MFGKDKKGWSKSIDTVLTHVFLCESIIQLKKEKEDFVNII
jgi:hypothetical protein